MKIKRSSARATLRTSGFLIAICIFAITALAVAVEPEGNATDAKINTNTDTNAKAKVGTKKGTVARAQFTSHIADREPTDTIERLSNDRTRIFFYSELRGLGGETISHRWDHDGQPMAEVPFRVEANRWRVWSSKNLEPSGLGIWTVSIVAMDGSVLASRSFTYHEK